MKDSNLNIHLMQQDGIQNRDLQITV